MLRNTTEIQRAIKLLLKRYDIVQAWKYVLPGWGVNLVFSLVLAVFALWFVLSVATFSPNNEFSCFFFTINTWILVFFANYPIEVFVVVFVIFYVARMFSQKESKKRNTRGEDILLKYASQGSHSRQALLSEKRTVHTREYIALAVLFLIIIYIIGLYKSLIILVPVGLLVILPMIFRVFSFAIFLPRIIITVSYVWVSFIFTEETSRYLRILPDNTYVLTFIIATFGSIAFLWFEAYQNAPSVRKSELLMRRVLPVFAYAVFFSVILGIVFETSGDTKESQSTSAEAYHFGSTLNIANTAFIKLNSIKDFRDRIESDWKSLPNISMEVGFQQKNIRHPYSEVYNNDLKILKNHVVNYNSALEDLANSQSLDSVLLQFSSCNISLADLDKFPVRLNDVQPIEKVIKNNLRLLQKQVDISIRNDSIFREQLNKQDSILQFIEKHLITFYDTIVEPSKSKYILRQHSAYSTIRQVRNRPFLSTKAVVDQLYEKAKQDTNTSCIPFKHQSKFHSDELIYTEYPIYLYHLNKQNTAVDFNLKRFLIQVIIAVAIGVVGQLILAEKTVTESI
jgi:hypothetical protein